MTRSASMSRRLSVGGLVLALLMLGCDAGSKQSDAGLDAGSCTEQVQAATVTYISSPGTCLDPDAGPSPEVTFRLRNASAADLWVPLHNLFGTSCRATIFLSGCRGGIVSPTSLRSELCPEDLVRLAPDASVDLPPYRLVGDFKTATCGIVAVPLPLGSYQVQFSYSLDAGKGLITTAAYPFTPPPTDGGVVEIDVP